MHLLINSCLGEEHSHENKIAGKMSTIPLVPKLKTAEKSTIEKGKQETEATKESFQYLFATFQKMSHRYYKIVIII